MNARQSDFEWLQQFSRAGNQSAFRDLVRRHIDLVFATALRKVGDAGGAEEISQNVFGVLARKAWQFAPDDSLPAWLHKTTLLESQAWQRGEMRRRQREQAAAELGTTMKTPDEEPAFRALVPLLDEALLSLREKDREALLLRYYESQSLKDVGAALGVNDDTAQKRVQSALEKLSQFFQRRGFKTATVAATTAALQQTAASATTATVSLVFNSALQAAPPALVGLGVLLARFASLTKVQTAAVCLAIAAGPVAWQISEQREAQAALAQAKTQLAAARNEFSVVQTEVQRLNESATQLEESLARDREAAARSAETALKFVAWKESVRARLFATDYTWPDDLPFVRIPKAILPELEVYRPVLLPGEIRPEARELLGLTPNEREAMETAVQKHFAAVEELIESRSVETNRARYAYIPKEALVTQVWSVPPLGNDVTAPANALKEAWRSTLGEERWPLVEAQLQNSGTHTLQRTFNLDGESSGQEFAVWLINHGGEMMVNYSWGREGCTTSSGGRPLSSFFPDATSDWAGQSNEQWLDVQGLPNAFTRPALEWIHNQAQLQREKKGDQ
ncbi:MAG: sigma-70 family RNA polymerase sigma factor [Verrucomicrobiota bacterium]